MTFWALLNTFQAKVCLDVAITEMVVIDYKNGTSYSYFFDPYACPVDNYTEVSSEESKNVTVSISRAKIYKFKIT